MFLFQGRSRRRRFAIPPRAVALLCAVLFAACNQRAVSENTGPFREAIQSYLAGHSMDLAVKEFKSLSVEGNEATADVSLTHAGGAVGVSVRWHFRFEKQNGTWRAVSHRQ